MATRRRPKRPGHQDFCFYFFFFFFTAGLRRRCASCFVVQDDSFPLAISILCSSFLVPFRAKKICPYFGNVEKTMKVMELERGTCRQSTKFPQSKQSFHQIIFVRTLQRNLHLWWSCWNIVNLIREDNSYFAMLHAIILILCTWLFWNFRTLRNATRTLR